MVSVLSYGADPTGVGNSTDPFRLAMRADLDVYMPAGTYDLRSTVDAGDFMLYLGMQGGGGHPVSRNGCRFHGDGPATVLRLGNAIGRNKLLFSGAVGDVLEDMTFEDFDIDLNGANNLQTSYGDPLRYNQAFYFFCKCNGFRFNNIGIRNVAGSQALAIGGNSSATYGNDIVLDDVRVHNFGIGVPSNLQQDCSALYLQGTHITVEDCRFSCADFTYDLGKGHTAVETHTEIGLTVRRCTFDHVQLPVLLASTFRELKGATVADNTMTECNYLASLDPGTLDQRNVTFARNKFTGTKTQSEYLIHLGSVDEPAKVRDNIRVEGNTFDLTGNLHNNVTFVYTDTRYLRSMVIDDNDFQSLTGPVVFAHSVVRDEENMAITLTNNTMDSCGSLDAGDAIGGAAPVVAPCFVYADPSAGYMKSLTVDENTITNSEGKDYSFRGQVYVSTTAKIRTVDLGADPPVPLAPSTGRQRPPRPRRRRRRFA